MSDEMAVAVLQLDLLIESLVSDPSVDVRDGIIWSFALCARSGRVTLTLRVLLQVFICVCGFGN